MARTEYFASDDPVIVEDPAPPSRREREASARSARTRRRRRRTIAAVLVIVLLPVAWSYIGALRAPGTDSVSARSVEWLRDHHFGGIVDRVESWWYSHNPPPVGGKPKGGIPAAPKPVPTVSTAAPANGSTPSIADGALPVPARVPTAAGTPLAGEGVWQPSGLTVGGKSAVYVTYVRPDAIHTSLLSGIVWLDPKLLRVKLVPGLVEPPRADKSWGARIPPDQRTNLVAAFNSAFRVQDSRGGYFENGRMLTPLRTGGATAVVRADGTMSVGTWGRDFTSTDGLVAARQNLDLIVDHGAVVPGLPKNSSGAWGATLNSRIYVWRSGVGVTANGAIVYVAGAGLSVESVADLLHRAGAVRAMELDINPEWVTCYIYERPNPSQPGVVTGNQILGSGQRNGNRYLEPGTRDFFAWFARS